MFGTLPPSRQHGSFGKESVSATDATITTKVSESQTPVSPQDASTTIVPCCG